VKKIFLKILFAAVVIGALACAGYFGSKKLMSVKVEKLGALVSREISYCAELVVSKTAYSEIVTIKKQDELVGLARSYSIVRFKAVVRMGIADITRSGVGISPDAKTVYVNLPPLEVLGNDITEFEVFDEKQSIFVPIKTQEIFDEIRERQKEVLIGILRDGFKAESERHAVALVTRVLSAMGFENVKVTFNNFDEG
jgi:hypothetical protein